MAKIGLVTPTPKDTRLWARINKFFRKKTVSVDANTPPKPIGLTIPCILAFVATGILGFALLINILPENWLTLTQIVLLSATLGIAAAIIVAVIMIRAMYFIRNTFIAAAGTTLVATIGWGFNASIKVATVPTDVAVALQPLQGQSLLAAIFIVILLFIAWVFDAWDKRR